MSNETQQETWNATHAQLLKSVADAQAKLLAGLNEVNDRLPTKLFAELASVEQALTRINGRLDAIGNLLAQLLINKPVPRPAKRNRPKRAR